MLQQFLWQYQNTYSVNPRPKYLRYTVRCHPGSLSSKDLWVTKYRPRVVFTRSYWNKRDYCFFSKMSFGCETGNLSILTLSKLHPPIIMWKTNSLGELAYFANSNGSQNVAKMDDIPQAYPYTNHYSLNSCPSSSQELDYTTNGFFDMPNAMWLLNMQLIIKLPRCLKIKNAPFWLSSQSVMHFVHPPCLILCDG